jgi:hypothetical protein
MSSYIPLEKKLCQTPVDSDPAELVRLIANFTSYYARRIRDATLDTLPLFHHRTWGLVYGGQDRRN